MFIPLCNIDNSQQGNELIDDVIIFPRLELSRPSEIVQLYQKLLQEEEPLLPGLKRRQMEMEEQSKSRPLPEAEKGLYLDQTYFKLCAGIEVVIT